MDNLIETEGILIELLEIVRTSESISISKIFYEICRLIEIWNDCVGIEHIVQIITSINNGDMNKLKLILIHGLIMVQIKILKG